MRRFSLTAFIIGLVALANVTIQAQTVSRKTSVPSVGLAWDSSTDPTVGSYNLYQGSASGSYTNVVSTGLSPTPTVSLTNLVRGVTYFFAATCVATNGLESVYSTEVSYTVPMLPNSPANVKLTIKGP
jgi:hypothetical protein